MPPPAQKAISHRPDLDGRVHVYSEYAGDGKASNPEADDYNEVYKSYVWVRKAVSKCAENIGPLPVRVVDVESEPLDKHPVSLLLTSSNDARSPSDLWASYISTMLLSGEWFVEIVDDQRGRPLELWPRNPAHVAIAPDKTPERHYYPRVGAYSWQMDGKGKPLTIPPSNMIQSKFYNPLDRWRGLSPIAAVREGITIDLFSQAWSKSFLKRGARPDFAIITPQGITTSERERYEAEFMRKNSGSENWHRPVILEQGITDIKPFSFAPADIEWLEQRKFSRDEVGAVFGVPDEIMGYGKDTYENFQTALEVFWTLTLKPLAQHRDDVLTHFFTHMRPMLKPGERVQTDFSGVGVLQEEIEPKVEMAVKLYSIGYDKNAINERLDLGMPDAEEAEPEPPAPFMLPMPPQPAPDDETAQLPEPIRKAIAAETGKALDLRTRLMAAGTFDEQRWRVNAAKALGKWLDADAAERMAGGFAQPASHDHSHEAPVKAMQIGNPAIDPQLQRYEAELSDIIQDAVTGVDDKPEFERRMRDAVLAGLLAAFLAGVEADGEADLTEIQAAVLRANRNRANESVASLSDDIYNADRYAPIEPGTTGRRPQTSEAGMERAIGRVGLWVTALAGMFAAGQLRQRPDKRYQWKLGNTVEHCSDCLRLSGQVHTSDAWISSGYQPQGRSLECGGWNCDCRLEETNADERGGF